MSGPERSYDVAIVGGGLAGAATAIVLKRARPAARILIVESREAFPRKVGESAIELSSWFLTRILELDRHLAIEQLPKYGLRFWFHNERVGTLADASELGSYFQPRVPGWHLDRARLDEHVLARAVAAGCELARPARVTDVTLDGANGATLEIASSAGAFRATARWVVDASGRKAWLARRMGFIEDVPDHPTRAIWARYRGTKDFDGPWLERLRHGGREAAVCSRGLATNHFLGRGSWTWVIPLPGGDTSVGVVWDERICTMPPGATPLERFEGFLRSFAAGRELLDGAERVEGDLHALNGLAYRVRTLMGDSFALVGDAAGFLDPFYSPGLDWCTCTVVKTAQVIERSLAGDDVTRAIAKHNRDFSVSYGRWLEAIYQGKYWYMGDLDLMNVALRFEVPLYYLGVVWPPYRKGTAGIDAPYAPTESVPFYRFMRFMNRRLAALGRVRMEAGTFGRHNAGRHVLLPGFSLDLGALLYVPGAVGRLGWLELTSLTDRLRARRRRRGQQPQLEIPGT